MQTYVIYDIVRDRIRKRISEACLDYGLQRIQYSAFRGNMNATRRNALEKRLLKELGKHEGKIEIVVVCEKDFRQRTVIEGREEGKGSRGEGEKAGKPESECVSM